MGRRKVSLPDNIFELAEITGGRSTTVRRLKLPKVDFSETHQIAYLAPEMPIFAPRKNFYPLAGPSMTLACLWPPQTDFSEWHQIAYFDPKILILNRKKFGYLSRSVGDSCWLIFKMLPNRIFGSQNTNFEPKIFLTAIIGWSTSLACLRLQRTAPSIAIFVVHT